MHRTSGQIPRHEKYPDSRIFNRLPVFSYKLWPDTIYCRKTLMCGCLLWKTEHFQEESLYNMYVPVPLDIWYPVFGVAEYSISSASPNPGLPSLIRKASHNVDPCGSRIANTGEEKSVWTKSYRIPEITKAGSSRLAGFSVHFSIQCFRSIFFESGSGFKRPLNPDPQHCIFPSLLLYTCSRPCSSSTSRWPPPRSCSTTASSSYRSAPAHTVKLLAGGS